MRRSSSRLEGEGEGARDTQEIEFQNHPMSHKRLGGSQTVQLRSELYRLSGRNSENRCLLVRNRQIPYRANQQPDTQFQVVY